MAPRLRLCGGAQALTAYTLPLARRKGTYTSTDVVPPTPLFLPREQLASEELTRQDGYMVLGGQSNAVATALRQLLRCVGAWQLMIASERAGSVTWHINQPLPSPRAGHSPRGRGRHHPRQPRSLQQQLQATAVSPWTLTSQARPLPAQRQYQKPQAQQQRMSEEMPA